MQCGDGTEEDRADLFSITNSLPASQLHSHSQDRQVTPPPPSYMGVFPYHVIITPGILL